MEIVPHFGTLVLSANTLDIVLSL